jgi:hypothetical protein
MRIGLTGQLTAIGTFARTGLASLGIVLALAACTTVDGTNALSDFGTFEREVLNTTARGVGLISAETPKEDLTNARAPLVLPKAGQVLPPPSTAAQTASAQLPKNSDAVRIDTSNLTEADIARLRNAKVVDLRTLAGRPLTEAEARSLTARMRAANIDVRTNSGNRPLYMPPAEYFTRVGDSELVCSVGNGEIVSLNDPRCPEAVRKAIRAANNKTVTSTMSSGAGVKLTESETTLQ